MNDPPTVRIVSPVAMTQFTVAERATLLAEARDREDGDLGDAVRWSSTRDGSLGSGASLSPVLSVGIHTLTAHARDSAGLVERASLDVRVTAAGHVLLAAGDIASCSSAGDEATAAVLDRRFGSVVTLGDNAYPSGTLAEFQSCYEPSWGRHKARTRPALGNHEYGTDGATGHFAYFGAAAGDPSQGWYSYDVGSWHIVVLNSNCGKAPRQFVVGTGGASLRPMGDIQPNSVADADHAYGVLELTLHEGSYDWEFVPAAGSSYSDSGSASCVVGADAARRAGTSTTPAG